MANKHGKYSNKKRTLPHIKLWWLLAIPLWLGLLILEGRPQLQFIRDSIVYTVVIKTVISGVLIFLTFFREKKQQPKGAKILLMAYAVMPWLSLVIPSDRVWLAILLLLQFTSIGYQVYLNLKYHKNSMLLMGTTTVLSVLPIMEMSGDYVFTGSTWELPFWPASVTVMG